MSDLVAGRYSFAEPKWVLDGQPYPPYRDTIDRRYLTTSAIPTVTTLNVFAVPVQPGDIFNFVSFLVKTAGGTLTHSWVALYNGVGTGAALLAQSADNTTATGWATGAQKIQLASAVSNVATPGQTGTTGPAVWGVAFYQSGTTGNTIDGVTGVASSVGGSVAVTGQAPLYSTGTLSATGTAPSTLPTMTTANGFIPYLLLSKQ
jgi:hypothetical protein